MAAVAATQAVYTAAPGAYGYGGAITSQHANTLRSFGNLGQVSTFSKTIDTPFSSVSKSDVRVSNPGYAVGAPAYGHAYAAPAYGHAYAAPAYGHAYAAPAIAHHGYAAPALAYGHGPVVAKTIGAPGLLGVAYSAAPAVAHMTYSNGLGFNYAW